MPTLPIVICNSTCESVLSHALARGIGFSKSFQKAKSAVLCEVHVGVCMCTSPQLFDHVYTQVYEYTHLYDTCVRVYTCVWHMFTSIHKCMRYCVYTITSLNTNQLLQQKTRHNHTHAHTITSWCEHRSQNSFEKSKTLITIHQTNVMLRILALESYVFACVTVQVGSRSHIAAAHFRAHVALTVAKATQSRILVCRLLCIFSRCTCSNAGYPTRLTVAHT